MLNLSIYAFQNDGCSGNYGSCGVADNTVDRGGRDLGICRAREEEKDEAEKADFREYARDSPDKTLRGTLHG
jgi:hypothetical protein